MTFEIGRRERERERDGRERITVTAKLEEDFFYACAVCTLVECCDGVTSDHDRCGSSREQSNANQLVQAVDCQVRPV